MDENFRLLKATVISLENNYENDLFVISFPERQNVKSDVEVYLKPS
jgi:hypothetical protein